MSFLKYRHVGRVLACEPNTKFVAANLSAAPSDEPDVTPGYIGKLQNGSHTREFVRPGVRRVDHGHAGLFDKRIVRALRGNPGDTDNKDDTWIMLGGTTALCRDASEASSTGCRVSCDRSPRATGPAGPNGRRSLRSEPRFHRAPKASP